MLERECRGDLRAKNCYPPLKAGNRPIPHPARYPEAPVLQLKGNEFCNNQKSFKEDPMRQKGMQSNRHFGFSLVRPWEKNPVVSGPGFWPMEL